MADAGVAFDCTNKTSDEISAEIEHNLWLKGFCVLDMKLEAHLDDALDEVKDLRRDEKFETPAPQLVDGLLGLEGSGEIAMLSAAKGDDDAPMGPKLQALTQDLYHIADCTRPFCAGLGLETMSLSEMMVIQGGEAMPESAAELTEVSCSKWVSTFLSAKLMMVYFMGPGEGVLEMELIDDDAEPMSIKTRPDMLVILRSDVIQRKHVSTSSDYALCSWIMMPCITGSRGWEAMSTDATDTIPGVKELNDWAEDRLEVLAQLDAQDKLDDSVPRPWLRMLRTKYFRNSNQPVAICGMGTHSPGTQDCEVLWKSLNNGVDYVGNVPLQRWNHDDYYDPDPLCYTQSHAFRGGVCKTSVRHAQFIDGIELFDNKFFQISQSESFGMEPQQRHILETSYVGLHMAGYVKKQLMTAYIAVFTGCTNPEAMYIDYTQGAGAGNVSQAITSNRTSFVLGIMGPSSSIDCEGASSHMALMVGASAVAPNHNWRNSTGGHSEASITGGVYLTCTPYMWPRFNAYMNPIGRCFTFDASADGYVRGESCTSLCQKKYMDKVDGEWVNSDQNCLGTMVGWRMTNNGRAASITAPHAPAQQEAMHYAVSDAGIHVMDVDAVECHGNGLPMDDSVEVSAISRLYRNGDEPGTDFEPILLGSCKSQVSMQCEACGMSSYLKAMLNILYAVNSPSLHLKQVNPHMEYNDAAVFLCNEHLAYREPYVFHGVSSRGFNGTNTHIVQWYQADEHKVRKERLLSTQDPIAFWPAGGGVLDNAARPSEGYYIAGSFNGWEPQVMDKSSESVYTFTVTVGINRFETFQILLDGDSERVLHPRGAQGSTGSTVGGPSEAAEAAGMFWFIDGGAFAAPALTAGTAGSIADADSAGAIAVPEAAGGKPGDKFEVSLSVAGKFRALTWKKVEDADADAIKDPAVQGSYYVVGNWNEWRPQEMTADHDKNLGLFSLEVGPLPMWATRLDFQVIRNKDATQVFHPQYGAIASEEWDEIEVEGPDAGGVGMTWCMKGRGGEHFKIEFQRVVEGGKESRRITWRKVPKKF
mmetsp:Transcript_94336/g.250533  ORF Transcript_94336/g.250533 Transcript_94336/m.250533 type:complete len:1041 (-) Transcript_94336:155-3277(-)|eukprot:CAMPEP_0171175882 /NCGR_PEP_ID=MMETSP0790-20130122/11455_1 /TAXON_ID=2925 /ORGANISM="Alexandrium catenella, Strain OF101" /LENGTH=1040 /DNA_ID=CAMNT_0011640767 /DNA_START=73 /DNA_END=3195 /DNA_ORIENTATION=-